MGTSGRLWYPEHHVKPWAQDGTKVWDHLPHSVVHSHDPQEGQVLTDDADAEEDSIFTLMK